MHNGGFTKRTTSRSGRPSSAVAELLFKNLKNLGFLKPCQTALSLTHRESAATQYVKGIYRPE